MEKSGDIELRLLIEAIYLKYSYDFRDYSGASVKRRVAHALRQFDCATISALQERVLHDPAAFMQLLQFLTIPVSEMFRDPSHFLAIRQEVVPLLKTYPSIKIWIAGCSTGEEVYSMAIQQPFFAQQDGHGVHLLPRAAPGDPDLDRGVGLE